MNPKHIIPTLFTLFALTSTPSTAAPQWWQQIYTPNSNSQITLKDENNTDLAAITNPTAASVKTSINTNTQPPTIIIQATGGGGDPCPAKPTAVLGEACAPGWVYVNANLAVRTRDLSPRVWAAAMTACNGVGGSLPDQTELGLLYTNRVALGGFVAGSYWSSAESSATNAWDLYFLNGSWLNYAKDFNFYVRCVRSLF